MLGFLIGTACLVGLVRVLRGGRRHHGWGLGRRRMLNRIFSRLETSPSQEKTIAAALDQVEQAGRGLREEMRRSREELARLLREEQVDRAAIDALGARQQVAADELRARFAEAFETVHATLDRDQRAVLSRMVERGPWGAGSCGPRHLRPQGPYREASVA